ncbi:hypothetical protein EDC04DRAFT_2636978, partial [Pisolithus marmoratus]
QYSTGGFGRLFTLLTGFSIPSACALYMDASNNSRWMYILILIPITVIGEKASCYAFMDILSIHCIHITYPCV